MKHLLILPLLLAMSALAVAQTKTVETVTTTDSTGKETTTQVTRIGTTEDITPRNNMITINPLKFFVFYNISYYHRINNNIVVGGGVQTPTFSAVGGWGVQGEVRFHPSGKAMRGFYVAPNVSFNHLYPTDDEADDASADAYSIGVLVGWQWFPGDEFAMGLGIGYDRYFLSAQDRDVNSDILKYDGGMPAVRFDIGYAF
jgi:hypothetical protein